MTQTETSLPPAESAPSYRGFWALVVSQFQGAFNDHAFKNLLLLVALGTATTLDQRGQWSSLIPAVFIAPFILFAMHSGFLADRYSKRSIIIATKWLEIVVMLGAAASFYSGHLSLGLFMLFLAGTQAAYYGPSKYGILPELVREKHLSWANGIIELTTFAAIILGTWAGTLFMRHFAGSLPIGVLLLTVLSVIGLISSYRIDPVPAAAPDKIWKLSFFSDLLHYGRLAHKDRALWLSVLGNTFFWFLASVFFTNIPVFGNEVLHLPDDQLAGLFIALTVGIGLGSFMAGHLSGNKIEYGLIPLGAILMTVFSFYLSGCQTWGHTVFAMAAVGFGAGFFVVPIQALIQYRPEPANKGGLQGLSYFMSNVGTITASLFFYGLTVGMQWSSHTIFFCSGFLTIGVTLYVLWLLPDSLIRMILWLMTNTFYRIRVVGRDHIPDRGGALFVANHLSFVDSLLVIASTDRFVRFIMHREYYEQPWIKPLARIMGVIPIAGHDGPRALLQSLREASKSIQDGDVVCIFAEGQMTRTGLLLPFRRGYERIMKGLTNPIVPIHLDRVWGSIHSFDKGRFFWKWPRTFPFPYPITVSYGKPLPAETSAPALRAVVQELSTEAFSFRKDEMQPLHRAYISEARRHPFRLAMADGNNPHVSSIAVLIRAIALARVLRETWQGQEMVGLMLPTSVSAAIANLAVMLAGKVPVNLNFTAAQDSVNFAARQCGIKTVLTARALLEKIKITTPADTTAVILEDLAPTISTIDKLFATIMAVSFPKSLIEWALGSKRTWTLEDMATVIFSSGSTGEPKGVMLSHYNIYSNLEGIAQILAVEKEDGIMGALPLFHSLGFTGTFWFPLLKGFKVIFHPNPIDAKTIGAFVEKYVLTILCATPTFLQAYMRRVTPEQFGSLRYVMVGAEKMPERVAVAFDDKYGIRPHEAYGCTECSPAVTMNVPGFRGPGFYQVGNKRGAIGHPLPGVSVRITDPDTGAPVGAGKPGLLWVKGPNVMIGYLGKPEKTAEVLKDGWYMTGDIAMLDEDGFVTITDRLSRFSKIAGEMVPHVKIEEKLHELAGLDHQSFAVTGVPCEKKGEKLVVLHNLEESPLQAVIAKLGSSGLPNLWVPRVENFHRIEAIPVLGTGKMDLKRIKELGLELEQSAV